MDVDLLLIYLLTITVTALTNIQLPIFQGPESVLTLHNKNDTTNFYDNHPCMSITAVKYHAKDYTKRPNHGNRTNNHHQPRQPYQGSWS